MILSIGVEMVVVGALAAHQGALIGLGWSMVVGVVMVMMVVHLPWMTNGMSAVAASAHILQAFEPFVWHGLVVKFKVKVRRVWNVNKRPIRAVGAFWRVPPHVL
jgi:hypothetical protein